MRCQAINHARRNLEYNDLSRRFHTALFLATPHRGADDLAMLNKIIRATTASGQGIAGEVDPGAAVVESINTNFRGNHHGIRIWSFYETVPTFQRNEKVVEATAATMGKPFTTT
jgi:hypothetical protein